MYIVSSNCIFVRKLTLRADAQAPQTGATGDGSASKEIHEETRISLNATYKFEPIHARHCFKRCGLKKFRPLGNIRNQIRVSLSEDPRTVHWVNNLEGRDND